MPQFRLNAVFVLVKTGKMMVKCLKSAKNDKKMCKS